MFVTLNAQCNSGHEWQLLLPKYWFSLKDCTCPECGQPVVSMKAGEPKTIGQIQEALHRETKVEQSTGEDQD